MLNTILSESPFIAFVVLPIIICIARIIDVSFGTMRIVFIMRGEKTFAAILGFVESLIWLVAIGQIIQNVTNVAAYIGWAAGFALGNYVGLIIEEKLAVGKLIVRVITQPDSTALIERLRSKGYGVTLVDAFGAAGSKVKIIFCVIKRDQFENVVKTIEEFNPKSFYTVEDVRAAHEGVYPPSPGFLASIRFRNLVQMPKRK